MGLSAQTNIDFTKYTLDNGLKVILHQDATAPIVAVSIMYEVGGKDSFEGRTGFAHFFEHLLFEGSKNIKRGEYAKYVEDAGGVLNANFGHIYVGFGEEIDLKEYTDAMQKAHSVFPPRRGPIGIGA
jgi:predicted Zn-dependent peptidase